MLIEIFMNNNIKCLVLLSTYNGEHYIKEQIYSILQQDDVDVKIIIRDDGSKDKTVDIIRAIEDNRIELHAEENIGCIPSFSWLVNYASTHYTDYEYFAFSDQDDYWIENKLAKGIEAIATLPSDQPNLYFCNMALVDGNLKFVKNMRNHDIDIRLGNTWLGGRAAGCTMVFNRKLVEMYARHNPSFCYHDYWAYLIAMYFGKIVYDPIPYIKYRQHEFNVLGAHGLVSKKAKNEQRLHYWFSSNKVGKRNRQCAAEFLTVYGKDLPQVKRKIILTYIRYHSSIVDFCNFVTSSQFDSDEPERKYFKGKILFFLRALLGKY